MNNDKIIDFNLYCKRCKHKEVEDTKGQEPCNTCLAYPAMQNSSKPLYFEEADSEEVEVEKID
jgi:hypothetical protein